MSMFYCEVCDNIQDADIHGCFEHPNDECECICYDCVMQLEAKYELMHSNEID